MTMGERIVAYRKAKNLTQKDLAEIIGISPTRLNYWEKDKREPDVHMINVLCDALDIDGDTLLGREHIKKTGTGESVPEEISMEETIQLLSGLGFLKDGQDITNEDLAFLSYIVGILGAWFDK